MNRYCAAQFDDADMARAHAAVKAAERETVAAKTGLSLGDVWLEATRYNDDASTNRCREMLRSLTERGVGQ